MSADVSQRCMFPNMQFDMTEVTRRWHFREKITCAQLQLHIDKLLQQQKSAELSKAVQFELDKVLPLCNMPCDFGKQWWHLMMLNSEQVFQADLLPDIGRIIRRLLIRWSEDSVLYRLYQYSMPYIKHNRLNFPSMYRVNTQDLVHMLQVMLATCLGIHARADKMPTWSCRRRLMCFFEYMLAYGSHADMYVFCSEQLGLLRLALLEHYMSFIEQNMPVEMQMIQSLLQSSYDTCKVHRTVFYITDNFRQSALQTNELDWKMIAVRAQQAVERCNRTCKSMPCTHKTAKANLHLQVNKRTFDFAFNSERVVSAYLQKKQIGGDLSGNDKVQPMSLMRVVQIHNLQSRVQRFMLPQHIQRMQIEHLNSTVYNQGAITDIYTTFMHCCLNCNTSTHGLDKGMRTSLFSQAVCSHCNSADFVCKISVLGALAKVYDRYYYYCVDCHTSHAWNSTACEFSQCTLQSSASKSTINNSMCIICSRVCHVSTLKVLNSELGVMQELRLCNRHFPQQQHIPYIYDIASFYAIMQLKTLDMCRFILS